MQSVWRRFHQTPESSWRRLGSRVWGRTTAEKLLLTFCHFSVQSWPTCDLCGSTSAPQRRTKWLSREWDLHHTHTLPLPSLDRISTTRCLNRTTSMSADPSHPASRLIDLLPSGQHFRSIKTSSTRLKNWTKCSPTHLHTNRPSTPTQGRRNVTLTVCSYFTVR